MLKNVDITDVENGDTLMYNTTTQKWENSGVSSIIPPGTVTNSMLSPMDPYTVKANATGATASPTDITLENMKSLLTNRFVISQSGNDSNIGNNSAPLLTIAEALTRIGDDNNIDIYLNNSATPYVMPVGPYPKYTRFHYNNGESFNQSAAYTNLVESSSITGRTNNRNNAGGTLDTTLTTPNPYGYCVKFTSGGLLNNYVLSSGYTSGKLAVNYTYINSASASDTIEIYDNGVKVTISSGLRFTDPNSTLIFDAVGVEVNTNDLNLNYTNLVLNFCRFVTSVNIYCSGDLIRYFSSIWASSQNFGLFNNVIEDYSTYHSSYTGAGNYLTKYSGDAYEYQCMNYRATSCTFTYPNWTNNLIFPKQSYHRGSNFFGPFYVAEGSSCSQIYCAQYMNTDTTYRDSNKIRNGKLNVVNSWFEDASSTALSNFFLFTLSNGDAEFNYSNYFYVANAVSNGGVFNVQYSSKLSLFTGVQSFIGACTYVIINSHFSKITCNCLLDDSAMTSTISVLLQPYAEIFFVQACPNFYNGNSTNFGVIDQEPGIGYTQAEMNALSYPYWFRGSELFTVNKSGLVPKSNAVTGAYLNQNGSWTVPTGTSSEDISNLECFTHTNQVATYPSSLQLDFGDSIYVSATLYKRTIDVNQESDYSWLGTHTFNDTVQANVGVTMQSTLGVTGAVTMQSTLGVTGAVTCANNLSVGNEFSAGYGGIDPPYVYIRSDGQVVIGKESGAGTSGFIVSPNGRLSGVVNGIECWYIEPTGSNSFGIGQNATITFNSSSSSYNFTDNLISQTITFASKSGSDLISYFKKTVHDEMNSNLIIVSAKSLYDWIYDEFFA
jgi:hypothetical protein